MPYYNYYRKTKVSKVDQYEILENEINLLVQKYGREFKQPQPEDYGLDPFMLSSIEKFNSIAEVRNKRINKIKTSVKLILDIFLIAVVILFLFSMFGEFNENFVVIFIFSSTIICSLVDIFIDKFSEIIGAKKSLMHDKTEQYKKYINDIKSYPGEDKISNLLKRFDFFKKQKKEKEYWFSLNGHEFERQFTNILKKYNYKDVKKTPGSGDGGIDIKCLNHDDSVVYIQCKAHKKQLGPEPGRALFGVMKADNVDIGVLVGLGGFTIKAKEEAEKMNIKLIDVYDVIKLFNGQYLPKANQLLN